MNSPLGRLKNQSLRLKRVLHPSVTAPASISPKPSVKMLHIPTPVTTLIQVGNRHHPSTGARRNEACVKRLSDNPSSPPSSYRSMYRRNVRSHTPKIKAAASCVTRLSFHPK